MTGRRALPLVRLGARGLSLEGLSSEEVGRQRAAHGANDIIEATGRAWVELTRETLRDPMLWFLLGTGALYLALGDRLEAATVLAALVPLAGMDAFLHRRTHVATAGLRSRLAAHASVLRDRRRGRVAAVDLVPGDCATWTALAMSLLIL